MTTAPPFEAFRVNGACPTTETDDLIDQAHAVVAALADQLLPEMDRSGRLNPPLLLSLAQAAETLMHLTSYALDLERGSRDVRQAERAPARASGAA